MYSSIVKWTPEAGPLFVNINICILVCIWAESFFVPTTDNNRQLPKNGKYISRTFSNKNIHYFSLFNCFIKFLHTTGYHSVHSSHSDTVCHRIRTKVVTWMWGIHNAKSFFFPIEIKRKSKATWQKPNAHNLRFSFAIIASNCIRHMLTSLPFHIIFKLKKIQLTFRCFTQKYDSNI